MSVAKRNSRSDPIVLCNESSYAHALNPLLIVSCLVYRVVTVRSTTPSPFTTSRTS